MAAVGHSGFAKGNDGRSVTPFHALRSTGSSAPFPLHLRCNSLVAEGYSAPSDKLCMERQLGSCKSKICKGSGLTLSPCRRVQGQALSPSARNSYGGKANESISSQLRKPFASSCAAVGYSPARPKEASPSSSLPKGTVPFHAKLVRRSTLPFGN